MSLPQVESTAKKIQRGTNFSIQEDNLLVFAFLNVNQDVVQSTIGASRGGGGYTSAEWIRAKKKKWSCYLD